MAGSYDTQSGTIGSEPVIAAGPVLVYGTGSIGSRHLSVLRERLGVAVVALPVRPERAEELSRSGYDVVRSLKELSGLEPKSSIVATDTARHVEDAIALLAFGDVLVEKPVAPIARGIASLASAASASQRAVFVAFPFRFDPGFRALAAHCARIGRLLSVRIECESYLPNWRPQRDYRDSYSARAAEGGVLRDLAHELDYAVRLFGRPDGVFCGVANRSILGIEAEESADLWWEGRDCVPVSVHLDYLSPISRRVVRVVGTLGTVTWDVIEGTVTLTRPGNAATVERFPADRDATMARMLRAFLSDDVSEREWLATLDEGGFIAALTDAARRSAASRQIEPIGDWRAE
jgi:predicted dehydrogenase